jgi:protein tyrosine phosphatase
MSSRSTNVPSWLQDSRSVSRVKSVLSTLAKRENERVHFRLASATSRRQSPPLQTPELVGDYYSEIVGCENSWGNRYLDIKPYDRTRVIVGGRGGQREAEIADGSQGRYINASWVRELFGGKWWIATQAPLPYTAHAFLSVILQPVTRPPQLLEPSPLTSKTSQIRTVVQLTQNVESGRQKAHAYFPTTVGRSEILRPEPGAGGFMLKTTLLETKSIPEAHCIQSTVSIVPVLSHQEQEPVIFQHMMYTAWPDHSVPALEDRTSLLAFIRLVDQCNKDISDQRHIDDIDPDPPVMVNCSAGIGRTGSFIALSSLLRAYNLMSVDRIALTSPISVPPLPASPLGPLPDNLQMDLVAQEVDSLREQRPGMVQRDEQISLIYEVLTTAFKL